MNAERIEEALRRRLIALRLEVSGAVWDDLYEHANAALAALREAQAENERLRAKIDYYENGLRTLYVGRPSDAALAPADEAKG